MAIWKIDKKGNSLCINNPNETAFQIVLLLEKEEIPYSCVDDILNRVKLILGNNKVIHDKRYEKKISFPK